MAKKKAKKKTTKKKTSKRRSKKLPKKNGAFSASNTAIPTLSANAMREMMEEKKIETEHVGGSVDQLQWDEPGRCYLLQYTGYEVVPGDGTKKNPDWNKLIFNALDPEALPKVEVIRSVGSSAPFALAKYFIGIDATDDKEAIEPEAEEGEVFIITYTGDGEAKKGWSAPKNFNIEQVHGLK